MKRKNRKMKRSIHAHGLQEGQFQPQVVPHKKRRKLDDLVDMVEDDWDNLLDLELDL